MPTYNEPKNYTNGAALTEGMLDDGRDYRTSFLNSTKLASDNIQAGGIAASNLASGSVTGAKLDVTVADATTLEVTGGHVQIKDLGVTTAKIADNAITQAKRAALGEQVSSSCGSLTYSGAQVHVAVTNLSVTLPTTGRRVRLTIQPDGSSNPSLFSTNANSGDYLSIQRGGVDVCKVDIGSWKGGYTFIYEETPTAGTYTYSVNLTQTTGAISIFRYLVLVGYEL